MADNFASYFPTTITGGTTNPMVGADVVQGQNPQALGLDPIIAAIQSQYTPQTFTQSGGSYGAGRFIDDTFGTGGSSTPVTTPSWFTPGEFDINAYSSNLPTQVAEQVATGSIYGGDSPTSNLSTYDPNDPYASWKSFQIPKFAQNLIGSFIPGAGLLIGAGQGYQNAELANAMQTGVSAYGGDPNMAASPFKSMILGAVGQKQQGVENALALSQQFENPQNFYGYMAAAKDPAISAIVSNYYDSLAEGGQTYQSPTPDDVGAIGYTIGEQINKYVSRGYSLNDAVKTVAQDYGNTPSESAVIAANLNTQDPLGQLITNLTPDPLGDLLSSLNATAPMSDAFSPAASDQAFYDAISGLSGGDTSSSTGNGTTFLEAITTPVVETPLAPVTVLPPASSVVSPDYFGTTGGSSDSGGFNTDITTTSWGGYGNEYGYG